MSEHEPVTAKKSLGQNWLADPNLARKVVDALRVEPSETVLEIGPGTGALTAHLLERYGKIIAVELDQRLLPLLQVTFSDALELIHADILKVDLTALAKERGGKLAVIGNLPYYASSPILFHLLKHKDVISRAVVTLQKEVVERCAAKVGTKDYGSLTVHLALAARVTRLFTLGPQVFKPRPQVASAVMEIDFSHPAAVQPRSYEKLEKVVRASFSQRRKQIHNSLASVFGSDQAARMLAAAGIDPTTRAERLSPADFVKMADLLAQ